MEGLIKNPRILLKMGKNWSISDIKELDIRLMDIGWDLSGGKSRNVWGNVALPKEFINYAVEYVKLKGKRPSIWTAYDNELYTKNADGTWSVTPEEKLPSTICSTFKCSRNRFSPIVENMAMRIAVALDLPTSYNFIVKYTPELHEKITAHINPAGAVSEALGKYGIVSVDMLKGYETEEPIVSEIVEKYKEFNEQNWAFETKERKVPLIDTINGDQLISFLDSAKFVHDSGRTMPTDDGLVENWIRNIREFAYNHLTEISPEEREKSIAKINSRIARSTLLRTFIGDCDYTAYNSGFVYNAKRQYLHYAPNFDYGEAFNALRIAKLEGLHYDEKDLKFILAHQPNYLEMKKFESEKSIRELAQTYESGTSEENLRYISTHFEEDIVEFMISLNQAVEDNAISDIIYSYAQKNEFGDQLITIEEAQMFDEYLIERANWISFVIIKNILEAEPEKFVDKIVRDKIGKHASFPLEKLESFVSKKFDSLPEEERQKIQNYPSYLERFDFIKASFPEEFSAYSKKLNDVIDNFWRKPLSQNFIEYFKIDNASGVISKDEVKSLFIKQFIDKTFERAYKTKTAPIAPPTANKDTGK